MSRFEELGLLPFALVILACSKGKAPSPSEVAPHVSSVALPIVSDAAADAVFESPNDLVDLTTIAPGIHLDMRYASADNFVGKAIYPSPTCLLRRPVANALAQAQQALKQEGLALLIWDCYRPFSVQELFWKLVPDSRYVARPQRDGPSLQKGSKHNRGAAVDLSLETTAGEPLEMPTDHDDFSERGHRGAPSTSQRAQANTQVLDRVMETMGFSGIESEWWHFDYQGWREFELSDYPLTKANPKSSRNDM